MTESYRIIEKNGIRYLDCLPEAALRSSRDALDLVAACGENRIERLLLHEQNLSEDFYQLKTGLAGEVLLKFSNYRIRAAAVLPTELVNRYERFREMVLESNRGRQFRVYPSIEAAEEWLIGLE
jgi:PadR family transcriptional regulator, regulatory protein AphA